MTLDDILYSLDTIWNSEALDPQARVAARAAYRILVAFKCSRALAGDTTADQLHEAAWTDDRSSHVPAN